MRTMIVLVLLSYGVIAEKALSIEPTGNLETLKFLVLFAFLMTIVQDIKECFK